MEEPTFSKLYLHRDTNRLYLHPIKLPQGEGVEELDLEGNLGPDNVVRWIADYMINSNYHELQIECQDHFIFPRVSPVIPEDHIGPELPEESQWQPHFSVRFYGGEEVKEWPRNSLTITCHSEAEALYEALAQGIQFVNGLVGGLSS